MPDKTNIDFGLIIRGDSMSPAYSDGDVVFVRKQDTLENSECGESSRNSIEVRMVRYILNRLIKTTRTLL